MDNQIYNIINDMSEVLNAAQMKKLQKYLLKGWLHRRVNNCGKVTIDNIR